MATILYNNLPALRPSRAFNSMLNEVLRDSVQPTAKPSSSFVPQADVLETAQGFELHLALSGVAKEDIKVDFQEGRLEISGERKAPATDGENAVQLRRIETRYGSFSRSFRLPETVNVASIDAQLQDGILRVVLPFDTAKVTKQHIEVR